MTWSWSWSKVVVATERGPPWLLQDLNTHKIVAYTSIGSQFNVWIPQDML